MLLSTRLRIGASRKCIMHTYLQGGREHCRSRSSRSNRQRSRRNRRRDSNSRRPHNSSSNKLPDRLLPSLFFSILFLSPLPHFPPPAFDALGHIQRLRLGFSSQAPAPRSSFACCRCSARKRSLRICICSFDRFRSFKHIDIALFELQTRCETSATLHKAKAKSSSAEADEMRRQHVLRAADEAHVRLRRPILTISRANKTV